MVVCAVFGCPNGSYRNSKVSPSERIPLYLFPRNEPFVSKWVNFCARMDKFNPKTARLCSVHFSVEDRVDNLRNRLLGYSPKRQKKLKHDAVPTLNGPKTVRVKEEQITCKSEPLPRLQKKVKRQIAKSFDAQCTEIANKNSSVAGLNFEVIDVDSIPEPNRLQGTAALREGEIPVNAEQQEVVEWEFEDGTSSSAVDPLSLDEDSTSPQDNPGRLGSNQSCQQKTQNLPSGENHITVEAVEISCVEKEHIVQEASNVATRKNIEGEVSLGSGLTSPSRRVPIRVKREK